MEVLTEHAVKTLLNAPVGYVQQTISEIMKKDVYLRVIEQKSVSATGYSRTVVIGNSQFPILRALVKFDSKKISENILIALLQKKEGIGNILRKNNLVGKRENTTVHLEPNKKKVIRKYDIRCNGSLCFRVSEEIRLDLLCACKDG